MRERLTPGVIALPNYFLLLSSMFYSQLIAVQMIIKWLFLLDQGLFHSFFYVLTVDWSALGCEFVRLVGYRLYFGVHSYPTVLVVLVLKSPLLLL